MDTPDPRYDTLATVELKTGSSGQLLMANRLPVNIEPTHVQQIHRFMSIENNKAFNTRVLQEIERRVLWLAVRMVDYANRRENAEIKVGWSSSLVGFDGLFDDCVVVRSHWWR